MTITTDLVRVLIASPGDAAAERDAVERTIHQWNASRAANSGFVLLPVRWESNSVPVLDLDAQAALNGQLVDLADIVIAVFNARLGTPTARGISGTVEEIERVAAAGKPVHVWFSTQPIPRSADLEQLRSLNEYREQLAKRALLGSYTDHDDLAYQVRNAIELDIAMLERSERRLRQRPLVSEFGPAARARLRAAFTKDGRGYVLTIRNTGSSGAEGLQVKLLADNGREIGLHGRQDVDLLDGADLTWPVWLSLADGTPSLVEMTWVEEGEKHSLNQSI